ncbi:MAG: zinc transporter ZntB [Gammaproteobacteria bacterium]|nr:zinc transporter ZntB [Gammaproteobacteria bacterium]
METDNGLVAAYAMDGEGKGVELNWDQLTALKNVENEKNETHEAGFVWVHLDYTHVNSQKWLREESGVTDVVAEALLADDTRPRSSVMKDGLLVMLRGVNTNPGDNPEDMVSIRLWIEDGRVITTRKRRLLSISDVRDAIVKGDAPLSPGDLLVMLSDRMVSRMSGTIDEIDEEVDRLENEMVGSENSQLRQSLAAVRMKVISIRRYLAPQREAMSRLHQDKTRWLSDSERIRLREISDRVVRYVEDLDAVRDRAAVVQEELASRLSEQMNQRMYMLSMVAAVFLPLGFLTGLLGVNVGGIPGAENSLGFVLVTIMLVILVVLQIWIFKRQRWF